MQTQSQNRVDILSMINGQDMQMPKSALSQEACTSKQPTQNKKQSISSFLNVQQTSNQRVNLMGLCKNRTLSRDHLKEYDDCSESRLSDKKTDASSAYASNSSNSSPAMPSKELEEDGQKVTKNNFSPASMVPDSTQATTCRKKSTVFYCQAQYKGGPDGKSIPAFEF